MLGYPSRECLILLCRPLSRQVLPFPMLMLLTSFSNLDAKGVGQDEGLPGMQSFFDNELRGKASGKMPIVFLWLLAFAIQNGKI